MSPFADIGIPDEALLFEVAESAQGRGLHIICNGRRVALSPVVPEGWTRIAVKIRTPDHADLVPQEA